MVAITQQKTVYQTFNVTPQVFVDHYLADVALEYGQRAKPFTYLFYVPSNTNGQGMLSCVFDINIGKELPEFNRNSPDWSDLRTFYIDLIRENIGE